MPSDRRSLPAFAALAALGLALPAAIVALAVAASPPPAAEPPPEDPLAALGWRVTGGAAPGYLPDRACSFCHRDLWASYQEVAMARSFYRPGSREWVEDFSSGFHHDASGRHYRMVRNGDRLLFRRHQVAPDGTPTNVFEVEVDWVLGSGNHSRTYLYRTPSGELYQLPLAWYAPNVTREEGFWGMAPGFDRPDHQGVLRRVHRECMFCHNAYPDVAAGSDTHRSDPTFPEELPEGIGCQRCHGPGAAHARAVLAGGGPDEIRGAIVQPGRLSPRLRDDVCHQCHMQPSVAISGVRRFGRAAYSFRPGESLADYRVGVDVVEEGEGEGEEPHGRFEINHHPYRLEQSECFRASGRALSCLTCHDPHAKVPAAERVEHYRSACLGCHEAADCSVETMAERAPDELHATFGLAPGEPLELAGGGDCAGCHMPKRRPVDVVQVVMTDHRIVARPEPAAERLGPRAEVDPVIVDVIPLEPERTDPESWPLYRTLAVLRVATQAAAADSLERALAVPPGGGAARHPVGPDPPLEALLDLAHAQVALQRLPAAERTLARLLERSPGHPQALEWLGLTRAGTAGPRAAIDVLRPLADAHSERAEARFNLGLLLLEEGETEAAAAHLEAALAARPNLASAWFHLGRARERLDRPRDAVEAYRRALAVDPTHGRAYAALGRALAGLGERAEALRTLRHGAAAAADPRPAAEVLGELEGAAGAGRDGG